MRGEHVLEIFAMDAEIADMRKMRRRVKMTNAQMKTRQKSKNKATTTSTTWRPPHVETQSVLQLHFEDDHCRRCEQCIRLDIRGSMKRLRQHQQVRDVMVNESRHELRPFWVLTKDWNNWNGVPVHIKKDIDRIHRNLGHPLVQQVEKLCREAKVSDQATEALKHVSCDACSRLKQPPARRQLAVAHA